MIKIDDDNDDILFRNIRCGAKHSAVLDINNNIYLFGANRAGQIGTGSNEREVYKAITPLKLKDINIDNIDCGSRHSVVLTKNNDIYTFGFNQYKQCSIIISNRYIFEPKDPNDPSPTLHLMTPYYPGLYRKICCGIIKCADSCNRINNVDENTRIQMDSKEKTKTTATINSNNTPKEETQEFCE